MKKRIFAIAMAALLCFGLFACGGKEDPDEPAHEDGSPWAGFQSSFARAGSSQYNNGTLQVKYLGNSVVLFEFSLMEGSEGEGDSEGWAECLRIAGTMLAADDELTGAYEALKEDGSVEFTIHFAMTEDGQVMTVTHTGEAPMNPDGTYEWVDAFVECGEGTARALIENLPTAATSLNSNLGAYTIEYPEEWVLNYFYPVTVTFNDTGAVLAQFIVTDDLTAVYRLDTEDGVPALIYGEAQTMLDRVIYLDNENMDEEAQFDGAVPMLPVILEGGTWLKPGARAKLALESPYPFACTFEDLLVTDDDVAAVSADGTVTAGVTGTATITGTLVVDDGKTGFSIEISVANEGEAVAETAEEAVG